MFRKSVICLENKGYVWLRTANTCFGNSNIVLYI